jgi:hypothetical protein
LDLTWLAFDSAWHVWLWLSLVGMSWLWLDSMAERRVDLVGLACLGFYPLDLVSWLRLGLINLFGQLGSTWFVWIWFVLAGMSLFWLDFVGGGRNGGLTQVVIDLLWLTQVELVDSSRLLDLGCVG